MVDEEWLAEDFLLKIDQNTNMTKFTSFASCWGMAQVLKLWPLNMWGKCLLCLTNGLESDYPLQSQYKCWNCIMKKTTCNTRQKNAQVQWRHFPKITCCEELAGWIAFSCCWFTSYRRSYTSVLVVDELAVGRAVFLLCFTVPTLLHWSYITYSTL